VLCEPEAGRVRWLREIRKYVAFVCVKGCTFRTNPPIEEDGLRHGMSNYRE